MFIQVHGNEAFEIKLNNYTFVCSGSGLLCAFVIVYCVYFQTPTHKKILLGALSVKRF